MASAIYATARASKKRRCLDRKGGFDEQRAEDDQFYQKDYDGPWPEK
jgi:hypothetical protein